MAVDDSSEQIDRRVYRDVLRIASEECPPHHYDLLGLPVGESSPVLIERAARAQAALLRDAASASPELLQRARVVLRRVASARVCLLDPNSRASYDAMLEGMSIRKDCSEQADQTTPGSRESEQCGSDIDGGTRVNTSRRSDIEFNGSSVLRRPTPERALPITEDADTEELELEDPIDLPPLLDAATLPKPDYVTTEQTGQGAPYRWYALAGVSVATLLIAFVAWQWLSAEQDDPEVQASSPVAASPTSRPPAVHTTPKNSRTVVRNPARPDVTHQVTPAITQAPERMLAKATPSLLERPSETHATPATPTNDHKPFDGLPIEVALPPLKNADSSLADRSDTSFGIGPFSPIDLTDLQLTLQQPVSEQRAEAWFDIASAPTADHPAAWDVRLRSKETGPSDETSVLDELSHGIDEVVARLHVDSDRLTFTWANSRYPIRAEQLRNCVLTLTRDKSEHRIQLRPCSHLDPVVMEFEVINQEIAALEDPVPPASALFLEVTALDDFDAKVTQNPTDGIIALGETLRLKLSDWKGDAEIRIRFSGTTGKPIVILSAHYKLDSSWRPLTVPHVKNSLSGLASSLARAKARLNNAQSAARTLPSTIDSLTRQAQTRDGSMNAALHARIRSLKTKAKAAKSAIRRSRRSIPKIEGNVARMKQLAVIGNKIRGAGKIQLRVGVTLDNGTLLVVRTGA